MRTWRVGTISMGIALLALGILVVLSQFSIVQANLVLLLWWPIILMILGTEILVFSLKRGDKGPPLMYDVFSILFIGFLGTTAVLFTVFASLGITERVSAELVAQEVTEDLPAVEEKLSEDIERIVLKTNMENLAVETVNDKSVRLFGTYTFQTVDTTSHPVREAEDYAVTEHEETLYVTLKPLPVDRWGYGGLSSAVSVQILVPENVELDLRSSGAALSVSPFESIADWSVTGAASVYVHVPQQSEKRIEVHNSGHVQVAEKPEWTVTEPSDGRNDEEGFRSTIIETGEETDSRFLISGAADVTVY